MCELPEQIFLCGFMGTGKTAAGKRLASALDMPFIDLDDRIEKNYARTIPQIFKEEGEAAFREYEKETLSQLLQGEEAVIALGGGALHNQQMIDQIKSNGGLVFIETPFSVIFERIYNATGRPLLLNDKGIPKEREVLAEELGQLYKKRLPFYRQAHITVKVGPDKDIEWLVTKLIKQIGEYVANN